MDLAAAKAVAVGDYVMSPYTTPACEPLRVTETHTSESGRYVYFRVHKLAGISAMAGGWVDSKALFLAPAGYKFDRFRQAYVKTKKDRQGEVEIVDTKPTDPMRREMLQALRGLAE